jgi:O-antigen/teichoic acid export membrane protein
MRELTLLETGFMASLLLASLVLPVLLSVLAPSGRARKISTRIVWTGQLVLSVAGAILLFSATYALYAAIFGVVVVMMCASALLWLRDTPARTQA